MQLVASHLVNPQNLHMASFPGIRLDNCPEPEPPLEEAVCGIEVENEIVCNGWRLGGVIRVDFCNIFFPDRSNKSIINNPST